MKASRLLGGTALAGALLFTAACGNDSDGSPEPGDNPMAAFQECMQKHGVTMGPRGDRPSGPPSGRPTERPSGRPMDRPSMSAEQEKAMAACSSLAPEGFGQGGPGGLGGPGQDGQPPGGS